GAWNHLPLWNFLMRVHNGFQKTLATRTNTVTIAMAMISEGLIGLTATRWDILMPHIWNCSVKVIAIISSASYLKPEPMTTIRFLGVLISETHIYTIFHKWETWSWMN